MEKREIEKSNFFLALQDLFLLCVRNRQKLILLFSPKLTQTQTTFVRCTREIYVWNGKATRAVFSQKKKKATRAVRKCFLSFRDCWVCGAYCHRTLNMHERFSFCMQQHHTHPPTFSKPCFCTCGESVY